MAASETGRAGAAGTGVDEHEAAVLVVGAAGDAGDVDLVEVVLAGALEHGAELERVVAEIFVMLFEIL